MVRGLDTFREHFKGFEEQYVLIGAQPVIFYLKLMKESSGQQEIWIWCWLWKH